MFRLAHQVRWQPKALESVFPALRSYPSAPEGSWVSGVQGSRAGGNTSASARRNALLMGVPTDLRPGLSVALQHRPILLHMDELARALIDACPARVGIAIRVPFLDVGVAAQFAVPKGRVRLTTKPGCLIQLPTADLNRVAAVCSAASSERIPFEMMTDADAIRIFPQCREMTMEFCALPHTSVRNRRRPWRFGSRSDGHPKRSPRGRRGPVEISPPTARS